MASQKRILSHDVEQVETLGQMLPAMPYWLPVVARAAQVGVSLRCVNDRAHPG